MLYGLVWGRCKVRQPPMLNALTIDLEDWYHPELVRHRLPPGEQDEQIEASTQLLLDFLRDRGVRATFFVLGEIAERSPLLISASWPRAMNWLAMGCGTSHCGG